MPLLKLWNSILGRCTKKQQTPHNQTANEAAREPRASTGFSLFGGGPHSGLCKLVKATPAESVLEISVDDGSRAIAIVRTALKSQENVSYMAIDEFEMGGGSVTLKQFHQRLRAEKICPKLFPETIERGLIRVARTVGTVDLVVIAAPPERWQAPTTLPLLNRITHSKTTVLYLQEDTWRRFEGSEPVCSRRAA